MLITTPWTLDWAGVSLLATGDLINDELKGPGGTGRVQSILPVRGEYALRVLRGLVSQTMSFHREVKFTTYAGAKNFHLSHVAELSGVCLAASSFAPDATLIALTGGKWTLANCTVKWAPTTYADRFQCHYQLEFGALIEVIAPPDPDPPGSGGEGSPPAASGLVTDTGDSVITDTGDHRITVD